MNNFNELKTKKDRTAHIREMLATDGAWALRGLSRIYDNQTADEQSSKATVNDNGIGFTGADAYILTSLAQQHHKGRTMTTRQMEVIHRLMPKYAKQLEGVAKRS